MPKQKKSKTVKFDIKQVTKVVGKDRIEEIKKNAYKMKGYYVKIGFFKDAKYSDGTFVAAVAAWNEFGVEKRNIPERPFFRNAIDDGKEKVRKLLKNNIDPKRMYLKQELANVIGLEMQGRLYKSIEDLEDPPNAPATIRYKQRKAAKLDYNKDIDLDDLKTTPLIDTGVMKGSVTFVTERYPRTPKKGNKTK